jgi:hypothetical protein
LTLCQGDEVVEYIEATVADIAQANALSHEVLGRSLDELPPQTRRLLASIVEHVRGQMQARQLRQADVRFTRKDVRAATGWGDTQVRVHLTRLLDLEYLITHRGMRGQNYEYELVFDGDAAADAPHLPGLIDVASLESATTAASSRGVGPRFAAPSRAQRGPIAATSRSDASAVEQASARLGEESIDRDAETHVLKPNGKHPPYVTASAASSLAASLAAEAAP